MDIPTDQLEVYTQFGIAAEMAQCLELDASNLALAYVSVFVNTDEITPELAEWFCAIDEDLNRKTLGQLLHSIKRFPIIYGDKIVETIEEALTKRNYLMHRFFPFHNFGLFSVEGRKEMISELREIQKKLNAAHLMLIAMGDGFLALTGKSLEDHEGLRERLLAEGRRVKL
jgi:hypothetical protein